LVRGRADSNADGNAGVGNADSNTNPDCDSNSNADCNTHRNTDRDAGTYRDAGTDGHAYGNADTDSNPVARLREKPVSWCSGGMLLCSAAICSGQRNVQMTLKFRL
jgi:hypothetical protein